MRMFTAKIIGWAEGFKVEDAINFVKRKEKAEKENASFNDKKLFIETLRGFLSHDLCYYGKFDGKVENWAMLACGIIPNEFKNFNEFKDVISEFSREYVINYEILKNNK